MKRLLAVLGIAFSILIIALAISVWQFRFITEKILTKKLGVPVTIESISYGKSLISIENVIIGNPPGSKLPFALRIEHIEMQAPFYQYFRKTIVFDKFVFENMDMNIEFYDKAHSKGNWISIIEHLKENEDSQTNIGSERGAFIKLLLINDLEFKLMSPTLKKPTTLPPLQSMKFENIQTANGDLTGRVSQAIIHHIVQQVFWKYSIQSTLKIPLQLPQDATNTVFDSIKGIFGS